MKKFLYFILPVLLSFTLASCQVALISKAVENNNEAVKAGNKLNTGGEEKSSEGTSGVVVAKYDFTSSGWATFGIVLPKGEAFNGLTVGNLVTQNDIKNRWSDGSIRYAILTTQIRNTGVYEIRENATSNVSFTPTVPAAELTLDIEGGGVYKSVLSNTVSSDLWLDGPLVKEWRVRDIPKRNDIEHPFLSNTWDIRMYNDSTGTVDVIVENVRDVATADGVVYSTKIKVDGAIVFQHAATRKGANPMSWVSVNEYKSIDHGLVNGNFFRFTSGTARGTVCHVASNNRLSISPTLSNRNEIIDASWEAIFFHQYGSNWRKTIDVNGFKRAEFKTDFRPFIRANAIPEYMHNVTNTTGVTTKGEWEGMAPLGISTLSANVGAPGGRSEIGPYPGWAARFIVHQTPELKDGTLSLGNLAGSFSAHFVKNDPSQIVTVDENPNYWLDPRARLAENKPKNNMSGRKITYENAHAGSFAYIPYLVTGDRYYSDEMLHFANFALMFTNPSSTDTSRGRHRNGTQGLLWRNEVRGIAWGFRNITDAANYLPDSSQYQQYFRRIVGSNLLDFDRYAKEIVEISPLGFMGINARRDGQYVYTDFWQEAFLAWSVSHAIESRDVSGPEAEKGVYFRNKLFKLLFEPAIIKTDFPPEYLAGYHTKIGELVDGDIKFFQTWKEVYEVNHVKNSLPDPVPSWGYGAEMRPALIAAKKAGYPGIQKAYDFFMNSATHSINYYKNLPNNAQYAFADVETF